ncbi:MAG: DUF2817 domain-containing protein, partial [Betaproteobacteria bacterium]|nr:DUF2817 domain-containing protein [Betaproteobacteria bacterium]
DSFECSDSHRLAYPTRGSFGQWCAARSRGRDYLYAAAEFGTHNPARVLAGLRAENQAHHWCRPDDPATERTKRRLVDLFCPRSPSWRATVLERGVRLVRQAIDGLAGEPH